MPDQPKFDPSVQTEDIAYKADELVACVACGRKNPPNRLKCMYCGGGLGLAMDRVADLKLSGRKLEAWEKGFNVVVSGVGEVASAALLLGLDPGEIEKVIATQTPLPIVRVDSEAEAAVIAEKRCSQGFSATVVSDKVLAAEKPLTRLSGLAIYGTTISFTDFNTHTRQDAELSDLALIVTGTLSTSKTDSLEKRKRGGKKTVLDESSVASDASVVDLYLRNDANGFRIYTTGFDFSLLGDDMGFIASENMRLLVIALKEAVPAVKVARDYNSIRHLLDEVWPLETKRAPQGLVRSGFAKKEFGMSESVNNAEQFTKYSRLQWQLL